MENHFRATSLTVEPLAERLLDLGSTPKWSIMLCAECRKEAGEDL